MSWEVVVVTTLGLVAAIVLLSSFIFSSRRSTRFVGVLVSFFSFFLIMMLLRGKEIVLETYGISGASADLAFQGFFVAQNILNFAIGFYVLLLIWYVVEVFKWLKERSQQVLRS